MAEEEVRSIVRRQTLDRLRPREGAHLRVFFPYGEGARVLMASGETRDSSSDRCKLEHRMIDTSGAGDSEWVPGWYVVAPAGRQPVM